MFDRRAFSSVPMILLGALAFGSIFAVLSLLADRVVEDASQSMERALSFGGIASLAYAGVATYLRGLPDDDV